MTFFIECYESWIESGKMPEWGLCCSLPDRLLSSKSFSLIKPNLDEKAQLNIEGGGYLSWGIMNMETEAIDDFTPLRQTIVLLCAVMEGEY